MKYKVMLCEGNRLMLGRLANVISATPDFKLVAKYQDYQEALGQGKVFNPNLILLDVESIPYRISVTHILTLLLSALVNIGGQIVPVI